ncbi:Nucleic acid-binding [Abeliophyllum distichum]|uniref:Nucleic acid-binding n=1 Tax=Abeliophyllum distichum TaxID=126358 RepID=A0ABD1Q5Z0_9LAMI
MSTNIPQSHNMGNEFQLTREVSPGTAGWTVKVVVAENFSPRVTQKSPTKYQNLILMDSKGSTVQATLYGQNIIVFQDELILGKTYLISNALIKETSAQYKEKSGEVQWTISRRTRICRVEENNNNLLISTYSFTDFKDLPKYMDSNVDISVVAMIIDIKPRRIIQTRFGKECQVQDLVLINKRGHTNSEMIDDIVCEKYYLTLTSSKLSSMLSVPTNEKDFIQINSIQGLKTMSQGVHAINGSYWIYINATAIGNPAGYFLQSNAENFLKQTLTFTPSADSIRLSMDEDEIFYVKAIAQQSSPQYKFEILFIVNPSQIVGNKNKGKAPIEDIDEPISLLEPTAKRSLFHSNTDDAQITKKNLTSLELRATKKSVNSKTLRELVWPKLDQLFRDDDDDATITTPYTAAVLEYHIVFHDKPEASVLDNGSIHAIGHVVYHFLCAVLLC